MAQVTWTSPALSDLDDIADYIALDNIVAAKSLVQAVFQAVERLELFPESGRVPPELKHLNYREVAISPCRIFYKISGDDVFILFVMRQERDLKKYILSHQKN